MKPEDATLQRALDGFRQELHCTICQDVVDDPLALPCNHFFCAECIKKCPLQRNKLKCPNCKGEFDRRSLHAVQRYRDLVDAFLHLENVVKGRALLEGEASAGEPSSLNRLSVGRDQDEVEDVEDPSQDAPARRGHQHETVDDIEDASPGEGSVPPEQQKALTAREAMSALLAQPYHRPDAIYFDSVNCSIPSPPRRRPRSPSTRRPPRPLMPPASPLRRVDEGEPAADIEMADPEAAAPELYAEAPAGGLEDPYAGDEQAQAAEEPAWDPAWEAPGGAAIEPQSGEEAPAGGGEQHEMDLDEDATVAPSGFEAGRAAARDAALGGAQDVPRAAEAVAAAVDAGADIIANQLRPSQVESIRTAVRSAIPDAAPFLSHSVIEALGGPLSCPPAPPLVPARPVPPPHAARPRDPPRDLPDKENIAPLVGGPSAHESPNKRPMKKARSGAACLSPSPARRDPLQPCGVPGLFSATPKKIEAGAGGGEVLEAASTTSKSAGPPTATASTTSRASAPASSSASPAGGVPPFALAPVPVEGYVRLGDLQGADRIKYTDALSELVISVLPEMSKPYVDGVIADPFHRSLLDVGPGGVLQGAAVYKPMPREERRIAEITFLVVSDAIQKRGVGSRLLTALREEAGQEGICWLVTFADLTATKFFRKQGFTRRFDACPEACWAGAVKHYESAFLMFASVDGGGLSDSVHSDEDLQDEETVPADPRLGRQSPGRATPKIVKKCGFCNRQLPREGEPADPCGDGIGPYAIPNRQKKGTVRGLYVHEQCADWAPDVMEDGTGGYINLHEEWWRSRNLKCSYKKCGEGGAAIGCLLRRCKRQFHLQCARELVKQNDGTTLYETEHVLECPKHRGLGKQEVERLQAKESGRRRPSQRSSAEDGSGSEAGSCCSSAAPTPRRASAPAPSSSRKQQKTPAASPPASARFSAPAPRPPSASQKSQPTPLRSPSSTPGPSFRPPPPATPSASSSAPRPAPSPASSSSSPAPRPSTGRRSGRKEADPVPVTRVILASGLNESQRSELGRAVAKLGGAKLTEAWSEEVTHVVARETLGGLCKRTVKYLAGVARGAWVISEGWVRASLQANCWKPEERYQLLGDSVKQRTDAPARSRADRVAEAPRLFAGLLFGLWGEFNDGGPTRNDLVDLIEAAGGTVLRRAGIPGAADAAGDLEPTAARAAYVVRSPETVRAEGVVDIEELLRLFVLPPGARELLEAADIVTYKWLFDSISCYALRTDTANYEAYT
eukprot:tig00020560_g11090.t1